MSTSRALPLVRLPADTVIHRFGTPTGAPSSRTRALLRFKDQGLEIPKEGRRGWAVVGDGDGRRLVVETLLSRHRILPNLPPPGPFPYILTLTPETSPRPIRHLAFARPPTTGEFTDFTARYGALQEEDKLTFRETLSTLYPSPSTRDIEDVSTKMGTRHLLDLPNVSLSSGQTRRARIAAALLTKPVLLLLEDPMAGLDIPSRAEVGKLLGEVNASGDLRVVLVLRGKGAEGMPDWVTDICEVQNGEIWVGSRNDWDRRSAGSVPLHSEEGTGLESSPPKVEKVPVVRATDVSISYGEGTRPVLKNVSWTIRPGERWHLQGANGSGKTTLLSLILGHHPRSFSLPAESLELFSKPRRSTPTPILRTLIGHTSPEIYASFPRGMGLSALEAVGSGFEGVFSRRGLSSEQKERVWGLLDFFKTILATGRIGIDSTPITSSDSFRSSSENGQGGRITTAQALGKRLFVHYTPPQQALLLFLRAIVARPPLVILDEPAQGMDESIWARCCELLEREWKENPDQAVVVVSHYEDEVPWTRSRGKIFRLIDGKGTVE